MPNRSAIISCLYATNPIVNKVAGINEGTIKFVVELLIIPIFNGTSGSVLLLLSLNFLNLLYNRFS